MATQTELEKQEHKQERQLALQTRLHRVFAPVARAGADICTSIYPEAGPEECIFAAEIAQERERELNAWADGQKIYVTPAMMNFAQDDNELATVLSHELAHNILEPPSSTRSNALVGGLAGMVVDLFAASRGFDTGGAFGEMGAHAGVLSYSSGFESEADYVGMYILAGAGRDYSRAGELWRRMSVKDPDAIWLSSTHPSNPERFIAMQKAAAEIRGKKTRKEPLLPEAESQSSH